MLVHMWVFNFALKTVIQFGCSFTKGGDINLRSDFCHFGIDFCIESIV